MISDGPPNQFGGIPDFQLAHGTHSVSFDRLDRDTEFEGDPLVEFPFGYQLNNLTLARVENVTGNLEIGIFQPIQQCVRYGRRKVGPADTKSVDSIEKMRF